MNWRQESSTGCSLFVGNIHATTDQRNLRNYFIKAGNVRDIYIPNKQRSTTTTKYAFVRFRNREEALAVARRCDGDYIWGYNLVVKPAHRERREALQGGTEAKNQREKEGINTTMVKNQNPKPKGSAEFLTYTPKDIDLQWLKGCAVGYQAHDESIDGMQSFLREQGIQCTIIYMGGRMVLLSFFSEPLMRDAINAEEEWFNEHFDFIKPWDPSDLPSHRYVWIKCENVPIHAWNNDFFRMLGDLYGKTVSIDPKTELKSRLDYGRCLIRTPVTEFIKRKHNICIHGLVFEIRVTEDQGCSFDPAGEAIPPSKNKPIVQVCEGEPHRKHGGEEVGTGMRRGGTQQLQHQFKIQKEGKAPIFG